MQVSNGARRIVVACLLVLSTAPASASAATQQQVNDSVAAGAAWIRTQQNAATGQITGFGGDYALSALSAAAIHPADVKGSAASDPSAQDYYAGVYAGLTAPSSTALLFGYAAGIDVQRVSESVNLVAPLAAAYNAGGELDGSFGNGAANIAAFTAMGLARIGGPASVLAHINAYLDGQQHTDGGWNFGVVTTAAERAGAGSADMTGAVLAAICETGAAPNDPEVRAGVAFLEGRQDPSTGAFGNVDSTAWAVSGLNACGVDTQGARMTTSAGKNPLDYLISQQIPAGSADQGAFLFSGSANLYSTQNAVRALAGEGFSADPPRRVDASAERFRQAPVVAGGTPTPHALAIDDGAGDVRFCSVTAPAAATLAAFIAVAQVASTPTGCANSVAIADGTWHLRLNRSPEEAAGGDRVVAFGDTVSLRRVATEQDVRTLGTVGQQGPAGSRGATGPAGPRGMRGRRGRVTCRVRSKGRRVTCLVKARRKLRAALTRHGRVYAEGTPRKLVVRKRVTPNRYTLRVLSGGRARPIAVHVR